MSTTSPERLELPIEGMTCASCATRIEKRLNKLEGVEATVNYATENAAVMFDPARVAPEDLVAAVEAAGYHAKLTPEGAEPEEQLELDPTAALRWRLLVSAALSLPVLLLAMIEPLQFDYWQWLSLQLATPVVLWGGWPFHRRGRVLEVEPGGPVDGPAPRGEGADRDQRVHRHPGLARPEEEQGDQRATASSRTGAARSSRAGARRTRRG